MLMLLPLCVIAQTNLVTWNSTGTPTPSVSNITVPAMVLGGVSVSNQGYSGFRINDFHNGSTNTINYNKYLEFRITANSGYKVNLSTFAFVYNSSGDAGPKKLQVRYSTSASFTGNGTLLGSEQTLTQGSDTTLSLNFNNQLINQGETLYIRLYPYGHTNLYYSDFYIRNSIYTGGSFNGPTLRGTVSLAGGVVANADTATTVTGYPTTINVTGNDTATNTTISSVLVLTQPANGTATLQGNNIVYTPNAGFSGTNTFQYRINGADGSTSTATVTVTVTAMVNPAAVNDSATTLKNNAVTVNVLSNDSSGSGSIVSVTVATNPANGTAVVNGNNTITYTPNTNFTGVDSFTYTIKNTYNVTSTATVSLGVTHPPISGALCGTYAIGSTVQYTYPQFSTITAALSYLNSNGVSCAVTFLFVDSSYTSATETFPLTITNFTGSSAVNTVTFKPAPAKTVTIEAGNTVTLLDAIFKISGGDNIIFDGSNVTNGTTRNLTIYNRNNTTYADRGVMWIASDGSNGVSNFTVKNTIIRMEYKNADYAYCAGIFAGNGSLTSNNWPNNTATAVHNQLTFTNIDFVNVKQGIYINGGGSALATNVMINKNDLGAETNTESVIEPVRLNNVKGFTFTENYVYNLYRESAGGSLVSSGVYVSGNSSDGEISKNDIKDLYKTLDEGNYFGGIVLESSNSAANILVANNFINNVSGFATGNYKGGGHGIVIASGGGYKIYHNTVSLNRPLSGGGIGYATCLYVVAGTNLDVRNNVFSNNQPAFGQRRLTAIAVRSQVGNMNSIFSHLDYNNYYSNDRIAFVANSQSVGDIESPSSGDYLATLGAWKNLTGKDANTLNLLPDFSAYNATTGYPSDLHLAGSNSALDNKGVAIAAITRDIDGQLRSTTTPDMGADEFGAGEMPTPGGNEGVYCASSTTWNGTAWSNGTPTADKDVIFNADFTQTGGTMEACSIFVLGSAKVNFISQSNAVVTHNVTVAQSAKMTFESGSNLVQIENTQNSGDVIIKRNSSKLKRLDYTLWSSPVAGQKLKPFSPATDVNRFYIYNTTTNQYNALGASTLATTPFTAGKGYLIRMPNGLGVAGYNSGETAVIYNGVFEGVPNNGNIRIALSYNSATQSYNAVGNPYPSPINITDFIEGNSDVIDGTIYTWRKTNDPTKSSYWTINKTGSVANAAPGGSNDLVVDPHAIDPTGLLNTGQGFIVKALGVNKELVFRNNMRRTNNMDSFFRMANTVQQTPATAGNEGRIWINVISSADAYAQTLISYNATATSGYDNGLDGESLLDANILLHSYVEDKKMAIQARPAFADTDVVPLGFKTTVAGDFEFTIEQMDGVFAGDQAVYIKDNLTNTVHNLKESNYSFSSETGNFETRFEVVYMPEEALDIDTPVINAKDVLVYRNGSQIKIQSPESIESVTVYDMLGKTIYTQNNIKEADFTSSYLNTAQQVVIVKVMLDNGQVVSKKIMMN